MRSRRHRALMGALAAGVAMLLAATPATAADKPPARSLAELDETFAAAARTLAHRATEAGDPSLAEVITNWHLPAAGERQLIARIPSRIEKPETVDTPAEEMVWNDFMAARRTRAAGLFEHAVFAAGGHDRTPTRDELAKPAADAPPLAQRSCEALRLLHEALRDDPHHERAREAGGWV